MHSKMKKEIIFIFGLLFIFLLFVGSVEALSITPSLKIDTIYCTVNEEVLLNEETCLDDNCTLYLIYFNDRREVWSLDLPYWIPLLEIKDINERREGVWLGTVNHTRVGSHLKRGAIDYFLDSSVKVCEEDTAGIEEAIYNITGRSYNREYSLTIIPYDIEVESSWIEQNDNILECNYVEYKATDSWLIRKHFQSKDYCALFVSLSFEKSFDAISPSLFLFFLLSNLSLKGAFYIILYAFFVGAISFFIFKIKFLKEEISLKVWKLFVSLLFSILIYFFPGWFVNWSDFLLIFIFWYLVFSISYRYLPDNYKRSLDSKVLSIILITFFILLVFVLLIIRSNTI